MQLVHRNARYNSMSEALGKTDGLMVLAVLFEMDPYMGMGEWLEGVQPHPMVCDVRFCLAYSVRVCTVES